jgi:hypothetical protein
MAEWAALRRKHDQQVAFRLTQDLFTIGSPSVPMFLSHLASPFDVALGVF